jgi:hypothetical protein
MTGRTYFSVPADMILRSSLELRMLEENRIEGLLALIVCDDDGNLMLHYDTTGLETLSDILKERKADSSDIRRIYPRSGACPRRSPAFSPERKRHRSRTPFMRIR